MVDLNRVRWARLCGLAMALCWGVACGSTKVVQLDFLEDVSLTASSRPLLGPYDVGDELLVEKACESDEGELEVQGLLQRATGDHDALVQVTVERSLYQTWKTDTSMWGVSRGGSILQSQDVCYEVSGYAADLAPGSEPVMVPEPAEQEAPAAVEEQP